MPKSVKTLTTIPAAPVTTKPHPIIVVILNTPFSLLLRLDFPNIRRLYIMLFSPKVETVGGIKDFLTVSPGKKKVIASSLGTALITGVTVGLINQIQTPLAVPAMAMPMPVLGTVGIAEKIIRACDPIIQLLQGASYPVCFIMLSAGFLVIMTGNRQKGLNLIKWAALGYIGMQFAPAIMAILVEVGHAIGK